VNRFMMKLVEDESGQGLIEYGLLAEFISLACVSIVVAVGGGVSGVYVNLEQQTAALSS
jgi:Flp pilus assembly pilin Flp